MNSLNPFTSKNTPNNIDEYILLFHSDIQVILNEIRETIRKKAPNAKETINYQIPTFTLNGNLVHFAAFKNHIGFYPTPSGINMFKEELAHYKTSKGSIKFPLKKPIPYELITKITAFRVKEQMDKTLFK